MKIIIKKIKNKTNKQIQLINLGAEQNQIADQTNTIETTSEENGRVDNSQSFTRYDEKLVSEDYLVGWVPQEIKTDFNEQNKTIIKPELTIEKKSYTESEIKLDINEINLESRKI